MAAVKEPAKALVTGGTGFIALELVKQLLEKGYNVRTTVRPGSGPEKLESLNQLAQVLPGDLEIVEADLLADKPFHKAVLGVDYVFHLASPFFVKADDPDPETSLLKPAVQGTTNLFEAVVAADEAGHRVRRVVLTSSVAALKGRSPTQPKNGKAFTDQDWNETSTIDNGEAYWLSKTLAEKRAWELAEKHGIELATILPDFVMGPIISAHSLSGSTSVRFLHSLLKGGDAKGSYTCADVRAVARAHVRAAEVPAAAGRRFIVANERATPSSQLVAIVQERFPSLTIGKGEDDPEDQKRYPVDPTPAREVLGIHNFTLEETLTDMARTLIAKGLV